MSVIEDLKLALQEAEKLKSDANDNEEDEMDALEDDDVDPIAKQYPGRNRRVKLRKGDTYQH